MTVTLGPFHILLAVLPIERAFMCALNVVGTSIEKYRHLDGTGLLNEELCIVEYAGKSVNAHAKDAKDRQFVKQTAARFAI